MAEYIVDGAAIRCSEGQRSVRLTVRASRLCIGGRPAACGLDCVPDVNLPSFGRCLSGTYRNSRKAKPGKEHPCVLDLMGHFELTDEMHALTDTIEVAAKLEGCLEEIRGLISESIDEMRIQHALLKKMDYQLTDAISKQFSILWQRTNRIDILRDSAAEVRQVAVEFCGLVRQNCAYLGDGNADAEVAARLAALEGRMKDLTVQAAIPAGLPKREERQLATTDSFLVCRCGGILVFEDSGQ